MLEKIDSPKDLKTLTVPELEALASEIRDVLIHTVSKHGGHLASNLGVVELTLALHYVLDCPQDRLVFDVGHQSYVHKLLTGRREAFERLRTDEGVSGFPKRAESIYDCFETGHASTAISAALGMARARDLKEERHCVAALVGDGALTGGLCYEALNDAGSHPTQLMVILNDNEMSIAPNVGALAHYFTKLRTSKSWQGTKRVVKRGVSCIPWIGPPIARGLEWVKEGIRHMLLDGDFFEALGFSYLGPIDGHDMATLIQVLQSASREKRPMLVHVVTQKGKGYTLAENRPEKFHGIAPFFVENGNIRDQKPCGSVPSGNVTTDCLIDMAAEDARVVAITAAMAAGTGLTRFALAYKTRFFDVGIAEAHAVTLAAGMASCGMHPYFAVYSTFLQRAYDQVVHDVCLQRLPVTFLIDRAGFVPGDGATHQGIFDVCFLRTVPNLTLWAPADAEELCAMLRESLRMDTPCAIRYGKQIPQRLADVQGYRIGHWRWMEQGSQMVLITYGALLEEARKAAAQLRTQGVDCGVLHASTIKPLDREQLRTLHARGVCMVVMEEQQHIGGLGSAITDFCQAENMRCPLCCIGVADHFVEQHTVEGLRLANGLTAAQVVETVTAALAAQEGSNE